jgi:hypothetical protein
MTNNQYVEKATVMVDFDDPFANVPHRRDRVGGSRRNCLCRRPGPLDEEHPMERSIMRRYKTAIGADWFAAGLCGAADRLCLAATPTFAIMALLAGAFGGGPQDMLCAAARDASPLSGMVWMYALMSAFHSAPWLKLISSRGRRTTTIKLRQSTRPTRLASASSARTRAARCFTPIPATRAASTCSMPPISTSTWRRKAATRTASISPMR